MLQLSIIVPVYNVEKYIAKCLKSLLNQNLSSTTYEIIIINDGSTDQSIELVNNFTANNKNITLINQKNQGLGGARNTGIKKAKGRYLMFVDSDDFIETNCLSMLLGEMEKQGLDILRYNHEEVDEKYSIIPKKKNATHAVVFKEDIIDGKKYLTERMGYACYVCVYLFRTSFIKNGIFLFKKGIYYEDVEWLPRVMVQAKRVSTINIRVYNYLRRTGSITKAIDQSKKEKLLDDKFLLQDHLKILIECANDKKISSWAKGLSALSIIGILTFSELNFSGKRFEIIKELTEKSVFPLTAYNFTLKQKIMTFLINISPLLFCRYIKIVHSLSS